MLGKLSSGMHGKVLAKNNDSDYRFNAFACIVAVLENDKVELLGYITTKRYIYQVEIQVIDTIKYLER